MKLDVARLLRRHQQGGVALLTVFRSVSPVK